MATVTCTQVSLNKFIEYQTSENWLELRDNSAVPGLRLHIPLWRKLKWAYKMHVDAMSELLQ